MAFCKRLANMLAPPEFSAGKFKSKRIIDIPAVVNDNALFPPSEPDQEIGSKEIL